VGVVIATAAAFIVVLALSLRGDPPPPSDDRARLMREHIIFAVTEGELPPVALRIYPPSGHVDANFLDGPKHGEDVVHTSGLRGAKLVWDLDRDGRISRDERTITERELYEATFRYRDCYRC
jgi:hypothetical protein